MKVLAIGAHPDDIEIACSGTLAKCVKRGDEVTVCHVSSGNLGHVIIPPDELRVIRAAEAKKAGGMAGIKVICAGFDDLEIFDNNKAARDKIVDVIKSVNPDFIITHNPDDYMPDHTAVSRLVFDASFTATLPNYKSGVKEAARLVPIYYMDTLAGVNFQPEEYVDISEEIRAEMLLELPMTLLCSDDCAGLCPVCGANLNDGDCGHAAQIEAQREADRLESSPFSALAGLDLGASEGDDSANE